MVEIEGIVMKVGSGILRVVVRPFFLWLGESSGDFNGTIRYLVILKYLVRKSICEVFPQPSSTGNWN